MEEKKTGTKTEYRLHITLFVVVMTMAVALACLTITSCFRPSEADMDNSGYEVLDEIADWSGEPYIEIRGNKPEFSKEEIKDAGFEFFTELDRLGRCGTCIACVGLETMPDGERGSIGMVKPSGWQIAKYDFIDNGGYLYNRCHLIGWQLTGQNEEERNLITGTRYMNTKGMLLFENKVAEYVRDTGNHVMYRSTPLFKGEEMVARGVQIEAYSIEDKGRGVSFNVFCYNVEPGVVIDYETGESTLDGTVRTENEKAQAGIEKEQTETEEKQEENEHKEEKQAADRVRAADGSGISGEKTELAVPDGVTYVLNTNTMRFHRTDCKGAADIKEHNRKWFYGTREEAITLGYVPCGMCHP